MLIDDGTLLAPVLCGSIIFHCIFLVSAVFALTCMCTCTCIMWCADLHYQLSLSRTLQYLRPSSTLWANAEDNSMFIERRERRTSQMMLAVTCMLFMLYRFSNSLNVYHNFMQPFQCRFSIHHFPHSCSPTLTPCLVHTTSLVNQCKIHTHTVSYCHAPIPPLAHIYTVWQP